MRLLSKTPQTQESRDTWWQEVREEVKSHAKTLNCNAVIGYTESVTIERKEGFY